MAERDTALCVLIACRTKQAWADGALKEYIGRDRLDAREAALASRLVYTVLQQRMRLDAALQALLRGRLEKLQPVVLDILRLGAAQILFFDKVPDSAAVNEAVRQARRYANPRAAGLVNGLLRNLSRQKAQLPEPETLGVRYSCPEPLLQLLRRSVGEENLEALLQSQNEAPPMTIQVNTLKTSAAALQKQLEADGVPAHRHAWCPDCLVLSGSGSLEQLQAFRAGLFYVQDPAAKLAALAAGIAPGMRVLDCCAAPGGKSFAAAIAMQNRGQVISQDLHAHKIALIAQGAQRLGLSIVTARQQDARIATAQSAAAFDVVLCDVPCSGLGVIRKKPDIRYKDLSDISALPKIQRQILEAQCRNVKPGGVLLYSTCTIVPEENGDVVSDFLRAHPEFVKEPMQLPLQQENDGQLTLLPFVHGTDGFYLCRMRREP